MTTLTFQVILAPEQKFYVGEDNVTGRVAVSVASPTACKGILATIKGSAKVEWGDDDDHREEEETYVENSLTLWSGINFGENLQAGEFSFPFEFMLPPNIPSSYEGKYGYVRYMIEAKAELPFGAQHSARCTFFVKGKYDLNYNLENSEPLKLYEEMIDCCCCCAKEPVVISLEASKTGYIPGESVLLSGKIMNHSDRDAEYTKIAIRETIKFMAGSYSQKKKQVIYKVRRPGFRAGETDVWASYPIKIPESAVCLQDCNIISAKYDIEVSCVLGFCTEAFAKEVIKVGSVPVGEVTMTPDDGEVTKYDTTINSRTIMPSAPLLEDSGYEMQPILHQPKIISPLVT